ncbi:hypothetical protein ACEPAI_7599 [Sanghuangporus weigelae]
MFEPVRGGTRGGQAEFKWSDVSADKDREHYLGHSINAPTGRWQKNKDVHWYNRDIRQGETEKQAEVRRIKEAEAEALAQALGFGPSKKPLDVNSNEDKNASSPTAGQSGGMSPPGDEISEEKPERRTRKLEKRAKKAEKKARKEARRMQRQKHESDSGYEREEGQHSHSPRHRSFRERERSREYYGHGRRSASPSRVQRRSASPPPRRDGQDHSTRNYDFTEQERERERDRRRWDANAARDRLRSERR